MGKVTFVLGLCGSGKSHLIEQLRRETGAAFFEGILGTHATAPLLPFLEHLSKGGDCLVEEITLCFAEARSRLIPLLEKIPGLEVEWICFENDLDSANWNVTHRRNKEAAEGQAEGHRFINAQVAPCYTHPEGARRLPITRIPPAEASGPGMSSG